MRSFVLDEEYLSLVQAAETLHVHASTIRRWIDSGMLPAYRLGQRRLVVRRSDVAGLITPARRVATDEGADPPRDKAAAVPLLTRPEREQGLAAMAEARQLREEIQAKHGGRLFPPSWEALAELRDARSRQLE